MSVKLLYVASALHCALLRQNALSTHELKQATRVMIFCHFIFNLFSLPTPQLFARFLLNALYVSSVLRHPVLFIVCLLS